MTRLRDIPLPGEEEAGERARRVVLAAHARQRPARRRTQPVVALVAAMAAVLAAAVALTPPGEAVADWVRDVVASGTTPAEPVLGPLPAPGRLLVQSPTGTWIVNADGSKRRLGDYDAAGWSPHGLFVAATRGRELAAVDPRGEVRWTRPAGAPASGARWAPDGFRIAYLAGHSLRLVAGDGSGDRRLAGSVAPVAPAWRGAVPQELAYADVRGRVRLLEPEKGGERWQTPPARTDPVELAWSRDGRLLLVRSREAIRILDARGHLVRQLRTAAVAAWAPDGRTLALVRRLPGRRGSELTVVSAAGGGESRVFAGRGRFTSVAWSPDGQWLALAWPDADQWLFVRSAAVRQVQAVSNLTRQFASGGEAGFPELVSWCCVP